MLDLQLLSETVQRNCDVSDAVYARNYSMCTYLLKMREYFRWERGYALSDTLPGSDVGEWVDARERLWSGLESEAYACLPLERGCLDVFDNEGVNRAVLPQGLVYSGGVGRMGQPHFFLGRLLEQQDLRGLTVYLSESELARDLTAPPAMAQGRTIYVRRESLRRALWELVQEWQWKRRPGPMARALEHFGYDADPVGALERMTDREMRSVVLHEVGEVLAGERLGEAWGRLVTAVAGTRAELIARAVRDHLADSLCTLPELLDDAEPAPLHVYFANLRGMRQELFPRARGAYDSWVEGGGLSALRAVVAEAEHHWQRVAERMLAQYRRAPERIDVAIEEVCSTAPLR